MITLIVVAALITAGTVWFLARPLARPEQAAADEERHQLDQVRERLVTQLNELDIEVGDHNIDPEVVTGERNRLEAELAQVLRRLEVLPATPAPSATRRRTWLATLATFAIVLPLAAAGLYAVKHQSTLTRLAQSEVAAQPGEGDLPPMVLQMVARLEQRLKEQPDDPKGWAQLGRSYQVLERPLEAKAAYSKAHKLAPDDPQILAEYAELFLLEDPRQPSGQAVALFQRLHQLEPTHPGALWVLGLDAYNRGNHHQAVRYWEALLQNLPPESGVEQQIRNAIEQARAQLPTSRR